MVTPRAGYRVQQNIINEQLSKHLRLIFSNRTGRDRSRLDKPALEQESFGKIMIIKMFNFLHVSN